MENLLKNLEELRERVVKTMQILDIDRKKSEAHALKAQMSLPGFWDEREKAVATSQRADELEKEVLEWENLLLEIHSLEELVAESAELEDDSLAGEAQEQYEKLKENFDRLDFYLMFRGKHDESNAIISLHAGTGGVDAQDWAQILERMFLRFAEKRNWKVEVVDRTVANEAGIKSATYRIAGRWAYGYLKSESGVHRLVRISPFDAEAMRHTSFALVEVIPELPDSAEIEIADSELAIDVFRSSGPGGQSVNTTDSAIRIRHIPTGIIVSCQNERSQHQNRETAMKILKSKLFKLREEERESEELKLRGEAQKAEWGKQIRSYVMQPYKMVKDHRTEHETQEIDKVLDGDLTGFMEAYLRWVK
ncbi:MAG: Peptide chain release factor 2 [Candidatus Falkowbacteria bacterium GW2011_GWC2_38_22]|nr:MAG: Peptide chain release factor 2 [Candidatus Falkowbacteria bacterium GW2011_GWC2_38_22]KKQ62371.1 MAG: Peptide chain release factor 2 [Candidatus Falkowbacteria bacterium GW2011_GWF1_38_22]KKQ71577.1 MAG: Peptide chain release factor 2 [Candidatus Falkowbacteria bacterium GW2011_GWD2_38_42]HAM88878.1 peptide chain release factor 2 [Candidatus Falkowbacteria bacterium]HAY12673.1 peptide chain release factor 2 [Candidatus Falkowbacteria bacterium]